MKAEKLVSVLSEASLPGPTATTSRRDTVKKAVDIADAGLELISILRNRQTITNLSKDSLLQFPILIENNVSEQSLAVLNKALEHEFISFIVLALNNIIVNKIDANGTVGDLLKKIHTNVNDDISENVGRLKNSVGATLQDDINVSDIAIGSVLVEDTTYEELEKYNEMCVLHPIGEELNESILNHSSFPEFILNEVVDKKDMTDKKSKYNVKVDTGSMSTYTINYKKLNMLAPTIVKCKVKYVINASKDGNNVLPRQEETELVFGVKTVLHPINTEDYIDGLMDVFRTGKFPVRLVKFLTGEMRAADFLFNAAEAKKRAKKVHGSGTSSYWWNKLEDLAKQDAAMKIAKSFSKVVTKKDVTLMTAVTTLVITKSTALRIKNKLGQNIFERPELISEIFSRFFIMGFMVIDEPSSHLYIYDTNRHDYKVVSLASLKAIANDEISLEHGQSTIFER